MNFSSRRGARLVDEAAKKVARRYPTRRRAKRFELPALIFSMGAEERNQAAKKWANV